ncbi:hypothetical protein [Scytonema sp. HK-05]|uniref:hypothetical protein n=1 Tax=Scytonema sp. HK-05 TaxID=1137095 RepID=UPI00093687F0|nr:hypothetical protein [Scytonema sp. HK-05]OKH58577.1 hypothetical protein NIES2130_13975 [Scytonema sp. HK-05]
MKSIFSEIQRVHRNNLLKNLSIQELLKLETLARQQIAEQLAQKKQEEPQVTRGFAKGFDKKRRK